MPNRNEQTPKGRKKRRLGRTEEREDTEHSPLPYRETCDDGHLHACGLNLKRLGSVSERSLLAGASCRNPERSLRRIPTQKEGAKLISQPGSYLCRQRPTLQHTFACSTIGLAGLNLRRLEGLSARLLRPGAFCRNPERSSRTICCPLTDDKPSTRKLDECPFPTLAAAPRSAHGSTRLQCPVHLCAMLGIRCAGRNRTD